MILHSPKYDYKSQKTNGHLEDNYRWYIDKSLSSQGYPTVSWPEFACRLEQIATEHQLLFQQQTKVVDMGALKLISTCLVFNIQRFVQGLSARWLSELLQYRESWKYHNVGTSPRSASRWTRNMAGGTGGYLSVLGDMPSLPEILVFSFGGNQARKTKSYQE